MPLEDDFIDLIKKGNISDLDIFISINPGVLEAKLEWDVSGGKCFGYALNCAAYFNQPDIIKFLVNEKGRPVNLQAGVVEEWTPLHHASFAKSYEAAAVLLELEADPALMNSKGVDTKQFCQSEEIQKLCDPDYQKEKKQKEERKKQKKEQERQEKIAGKWRRAAHQEVVHEYELPEASLRLTDVFNFELRFWRSIAKELSGGGITQNIVFFDDMPDTQIAHQACRKLKELGGDVDEDVIDSRPLRDKILQRKPL